MKHFELGDKVRDRASGVEGVVVGVTNYLTGNNRVFIESKNPKSGKLIRRWYYVNIDLLNSDPGKTTKQTRVSRSSSSKKSPRTMKIYQAYLWRDSRSGQEGEETCQEGRGRERRYQGVDREGCMRTARFCEHCGAALRRVEGARTYDEESGDPLLEIAVECPKRINDSWFKRTFGDGTRWKHTRQFVGQFNLATSKFQSQYCQI
jgi:hypothetical protein